MKVNHECIDALGDFDFKESAIIWLKMNNGIIIIKGLKIRLQTQNIL